MGYNVVPTQITGDAWTAGNNNTYVRDNFKVSIPDIFTAAGDIAYATGANIAAPLAIGTSRQDLQVNNAGTAPEYTDMIGCCLYESTSWGYYDSIGSTGRKMTFTSAIYDTDSFWSVADNDAVIVPFDGIYQLSGVVRVSTVGDGALIYFTIQIGPSSTTIYNRCILRDEFYSQPELGIATFCYIGDFNAGDDVYLYLKSAHSGYEGGTIVAGTRYYIKFMGTSP